MANIIVANNVKKNYSGVKALIDGCLTAKPGEVVALIGANGSGKSTLCKIITGVVAPDEGQLHLNDRPLDLSSPQDALKHGITAVYQDLSLVPTMSVSQNIWLTREPLNGFMVDHQKRHQLTQDLVDLFADTVRSSFKPDTLVGELTSDEQQIVEILKAISMNPKILILDEATSSLDKRQVECLFDLIQHWKQKGIAIIFISHRLNEVLNISDKISVLRNGKTVGEFNTKNTNEKQLIDLMVGETQLRNKEKFEIERKNKKKVVLEVVDLKAGQLKGVTFSVNSGEILGIGGLQGQGQSDILYAIFGSKPTSGDIILEGKNVSHTHPLQSMQSGIAFVPGDRAKEGLLMRSSIFDNLMLPSWINYGFPLSVNQARQEAKKISESLNIIMKNLDMPVNSLSGGNAQKVVLGKWLKRRPKILLLNDPTKGVDVRAKVEIYELLKDLLRQGTAILFYSSDDEELVTLCDRVLVMREGRIRKTIEKTELSLSNLVKSSLSVDQVN